MIALSTKNKLQVPSHPQKKWDTKAAALKKIIRKKDVYIDACYYAELQKH